MSKTLKRILLILIVLIGAILLLPKFVQADSFTLDITTDNSDWLNQDEVMYCIEMNQPYTDGDNYKLEGTYKFGGYEGVTPGVKDLKYYYKSASDSEYTSYDQYTIPLGIIYIYENGESLRSANRYIKYTIGSRQGYGPYVDPSQWAMWFMVSRWGNLTGPLANTFSNSTTEWDGKHGVAVVDNNKIIAVSSVMQDSDTAAMGRCLDIRNQQRAYDLWKAALDCVEEDPETGEVSINGVDLTKTYYISVYRNTSSYGQKLIKISEKEPEITIPDNPRIVFKKIDERGHELSGAEFTITISGAYWYDEWHTYQGSGIPYTYRTYRTMARMETT